MTGIRQEAGYFHLLQRPVFDHPHYQCHGEGRLHRQLFADILEGCRRITILGNFVFISEENKSKEIQGKNVLSLTKFVLGVFVQRVLAWAFLSGGFLS